MYRASNTSIAAQYEENMALCGPTSRPHNMTTKKAPVATGALFL
jgi:hypothetical protein